MRAGGVAPLISDRLERGADIGDLLDDVEKVTAGSRQPVDAGLHLLQLADYAADQFDALDHEIVVMIDVGGPHRDRRRSGASDHPSLIVDGAADQRQIGEAGLGDIGVKA